MSPETPPFNPLQRLALIPLLGGLTLATLGLLMIYFPDEFVWLLMSLLGFFTFVTGALLTFIGIGLFGKLPSLPTSFRLGRWEMRNWTRKD
jgi:cytochrome b subunit of formate dehydrogenase